MEKTKVCSRFADQKLKGLKRKTTTQNSMVVKSALQVHVVEIAEIDSGKAS